MCASVYSSLLLFTLTTTTTISFKVNTCTIKMDVTIQDLDNELNKEVCENYSNGIDGLVQVGPQKWLVPKKYEQEAAKYCTFKVRPDDIWITGVPRSGTTLTEEMIWYIINDLDFEKAKAVPSLKRIPYFEANLTLPAGKAVEEMLSASEEQRIRFSYRRDALDILNTSTDRRIIKTHLPFCLLPKDIFTKGCKVIYVARNPRDVIVSFYHLQRNIPCRQFVGTFETYFKYFKNNLVFFNPYWNHVQQGWEKRNDKNFKFIFYENLTKNLRENIVGMTKFLEKDLSEIQVDRLEDSLGFNKFQELKYKNEPALNKSNFVRKGTIGGWKEYFVGPLAREAEDWIEENVKKTGVEYPVI